MRQIVLDTETTGIGAEKGHRIIEIGCVELIDRKLTGRHYHQYINPMRSSDEEAVAVHGFTDEFLADKPVYVYHMSGVGCEMGEAIIPPTNCSGSDQVSFSRATTRDFYLNLLCPAGAEVDFTLNGSTTIIDPNLFDTVPGTGGQWMGAQIQFNQTDIPVGTPNLLTNSSISFPDFSFE